MSFAALNTSLLEGSNMNIGRFLESLQGFGHSVEENPAFPSSLNTKLCSYARMAGVRTCECSTDIAGTPSAHKLILSGDLIKYLQDKWNLRLDFACNYTGAIPSQVYNRRNNLVDSIRDWSTYEGPSVFDALSLILTGTTVEVCPANQDWMHRVDAQGRKIFPRMTDTQRKIFARPDVYVEVDKDDVSAEAVYARAAWFSEFMLQMRLHKGNVYKSAFTLCKPRKTAYEKKLQGAVSYWCSKAIPGLVFGAPAFRLVLAPAESFTHEETLQERFLSEECHVREYLTGEYHFREMEHQLHNKKGTQSRSVERLGDPEVIKRKPAKDPVLLQLTRRGFAVLAAWSSETDEIYKAGEVLRLI